jgi:hypothetical protein
MCSSPGHAHAWPDIGLKDSHELRRLAQFVFAQPATFIGVWSEYFSRFAKDGIQA